MKTPQPMINRKYLTMMIDKLTKIKEYEHLLKTHDFYYQMSDDIRWWEQGHSQHEKILKLREELDIRCDGAGSQLYEKYCPFQNKVH